MLQINNLIIMYKYNTYLILIIIISKFKINLNSKFESNFINFILNTQYYTVPRIHTIKYTWKSIKICIRYCK